MVADALPSPNRRTVLLFAGVGLLASAVGGGELLVHHGPTSGPVRHPLLRSRFTPGLGKRFTASGPGGRHRLVLAEVLDVTHAAPSSERSFNLIFHVVGSSRPAEGIYQLTSTGLPAASVFLSPVGQRGTALQALVNSPS